MTLPKTRDIVHAGPIVVLATALMILLFTPVPVSNKELASSIIAGLLGFLSRPPQTPSAKDSINDA